VELADLHPEQGGFPTEPKGSDPQSVCVGQDATFQLGQGGIGMDVVETTQKLMLRFHIAPAPIAADADPQDSWRTPLPFRLAHGIKDHTADAFEVPSRVERRIGNAVLTTDVFAAPALEDKGHLNGGFVPFRESDGRESLADVVSAVFSGHRIHGVVPEVLFCRRPGRRILTDPDDLPHGDAFRMVDKEDRQPRILANGALSFLGHRDVLEKKGKGEFGGGAWFFRRPGIAQGLLHIGGKLTSGHPDQLEDRLLEGFAVDPLCCRFQ